MKDEVLSFIERDIDNVFDRIWKAEVIGTSVPAFGKIGILQKEMEN